ncbi:MAG: hypothetical protein KC944_16875, partial [Candidatus Omnitrophica bacterium]|nr:hypothetical protein [Candidatus Omnitrophota bacterium]
QENPQSIDQERHHNDTNQNFTPHRNPPPPVLSFIGRFQGKFDRFGEIPYEKPDYLALDRVGNPALAPPPVSD